MAQLIKTTDGLAIASVKTDLGVAIASVKTIDGIDNTSGGGGFTQKQTQGNDTDKNDIGDGSTLELASSFTASSGYSIAKVRVRLKKTGTPTFTIIARLYNNGTGPGTQNGADSVETLTASTLTTSYADVDFTWASPMALTNATRYWISMRASGHTNASNMVSWAGNPLGTESQWGRDAGLWTLTQALMDGTLTTYTTP